MMSRIALSAALCLSAGAAMAFDASVARPAAPVVLAQYFNHNTGQMDAPGEPEGGAGAGSAAGSDPAAMPMRIERLERDLRRLTGQNEELQHKVQVLEEQLRAANAGRPVDSAAPGATAHPVTPGATTPAASTPPAPAPVGGGRRGDAFDPAAEPNAPGAPKPLGATAPSAPLTSPPRAATGAVTNAPPVREVGQPLDIAHGRLVGDATTPAPEIAPAPEAVPLGPKEEYEEAVGMLKAGKFEAAEKSLQSFLARNPKSKFAPAATFNLGESFFLRARHREAAERYLEITTKYGQSAQAPDALLRLGQSLGAMGAKEQACASFNEVGVKYPGSAVRIRDAAQRESKKLQC
ncbi:tol-pal system protein YbgF [Methylocystis echinoides]|uniref:Cell division coordinator CpoB n=1 Tax=Methylocystis echinoides TaxID=29468 RepID=A0A9W6GTU2_9HYPH|nr:tol-pal system protein YbgF [Methylocystis echinoides]GLI92957.1 tol-pal system protein YbgF [Methylocystis echinoides]